MSNDADTYQSENVVPFPEILGGKSPQEVGPLKTTGGGNNSGGMEARVAVLETHMAHVREDVGTLKTNVQALLIDSGRLQERVAALPSKGFIVSAVVGMGAVLGAVTLFGPTLAHILGLK